MGYSLEAFRVFLASNEGQRLLALMILRASYAQALHAGPFRAGLLVDHLSGDSWQPMAAVDRLVELGVLVERQSTGEVWQNRLFVMDSQLVRGSRVR